MYQTTLSSQGLLNKPPFAFHFSGKETGGKGLNQITEKESDRAKIQYQALAKKWGNEILGFCWWKINLCSHLRLYLGMLGGARCISLYHLQPPLNGPEETQRGPQQERGTMCTAAVCSIHGRKMYTFLDSTDFPRWQGLKSSLLLAVVFATVVAGELRDRLSPGYKPLKSPPHALSLSSVLQLHSASFFQYWDISHPPGP